MSRRSSDFSKVELFKHNEQRLRGSGSGKGYTHANETQHGRLRCWWTTCSIMSCTRVWEGIRSSKQSSVEQTSRQNRGIDCPTYFFKDNFVPALLIIGPVNYSNASDHVSLRVKYISSAKTSSASGHDNRWQLERQLVIAFTYTELHTKLCVSMQADEGNW